ncbi:MAG TPA: preprotein translocase subunit SecE [Gemmataceae bacterium]|nr:preprotein translocase subunit SecE [Gemmataceae bacterium]
MAVAVKTTPEVASSSLLDRMAIASLAGAAYVLGTLGIVFYLLPSLWQSLGLEGSGALIFRSLVQLGALVGLVWYGARLLGPKAVPGIRAGIFIALAGFLLILLLTRWASVWIEYWSYDRGWFGPSIGALVTAGIGAGLLVLGGRLFLRPGTERFLVGLEEQGWFSARPYKALQGLRVRRGTVFGLLLLIGSGIWTMMSHGTLRKGPADWQLNVPFTGRVTIESRGDVPPTELEKYAPDWETRLAEHSLVVDRSTFQEINKSVDPATHVKIIEPGSSKFHTDQVVPRSDYNEELRDLKKNEGVEPQVTAPQPASGPLAYRGLTLVPSVQFTVPLLMLAAGLWLAWRSVNVPVFADFLIATEAEMNKVSWTTQRRLVQDTIVVLVCVVLMAFYLFSMDVVWKSVLSWPPIGVLKISSEDQKEAAQPPEDREW